MYQPPAKRRHTGTEQQVTYRGRPQIPDGAAPGEAVLGPDDGKSALCAHKIAENLYLGSREAAERPVAELRALGISAVVNCTRDGAVDGVPCVHAGDGVEYCRVGVHDNETADISSYLGIASSWIAARRSAGKGVLVHCQMGRSRSATITIAALMAVEGLSRDAAYLKVKGARPMAEPNQGFWEQLAMFEAELVSTAAAGAEASADAAASAIDEVWLQRALAKFEFSRRDVSIGLPTDADGLKDVVRGGVDFWLGRGCDPSTSRWLHAILQHTFSAASEDMRAGAVEGLRGTLLSPEYMTDWACELRQPEVTALGSLLREATAADLTEPQISGSGELDDGARIVRDIIVAAQRSE